MMKWISVTITAILIVGALMFLINVEDKQRYRSSDNIREISAKVEEMSLDEKIGQMIVGGIDGTEINNETKDMIEHYHIGGVILFTDNIESKTQTVNLMNDMKKVNENNPYPLLLGVDEEGGSVTRMPEEITSLPPSGSIGKEQDQELAFEVGTLLGKQMQGLGFNLDFAPVLDVNSNPDNPVIGDRSFGDNPDIVSDMGIQTMKGIQSEGIISVVKHFPGHGDTSEDSHLELPKVDKSLKELLEVELVPFEKAISNGADVVMTAHILLPQMDATYPASMSENMITGLLRDDMGFNGVVISDDLTMGAITENFRIEEAAIQSVKAGSDMILIAHHPNAVTSVHEALKAAVENGDISEVNINESVERIIHLKRKYKLSNEETPQTYFQWINEKVQEILNKVS
ncbi:MULTISPECIES: beta-N-acetylhexosaminidase [Oceanobacillus]|uniref:beta-N-acetylhexosaminidase n=1 Tax=Oceanobacillus TaxID=182709 RepID=UPI0009862A3E|nr:MULTISPECIES: beta-N-acetylhexosaminidase [Oceanobacillus]MBT2653167.1 beta-N-acetylhexosaminidase [Oceanobacillus sp. ISL-73]MCT1577771.1 beta-N-acetylhexosaminidase [Oceanobacillus kimchii]MCT2136759.1 beta-N-acetylhexosaminidase [Oceanobacillus kimchii]